ncbi:MAG: hypothetical protein NZ580_03800 [Bacteroidia bacterium]|nr:hypothetical protein [Bacteroidia bacterium]MDW8235452.1 hypothetical protein [Bacteroidia bacterium]
MQKEKIWGYLTLSLAVLAFIALFLPQFRITIQEGGDALIYFWGGHAKVGATVPASLYLIALGWAILGVAALGWAVFLVRRKDRRTIAWLNWAAFFIAMQLVFLLTAAEEILTDLRVQELHADSLAQAGSWIAFGVMVILLFLPGRVKKSLFATDPSLGRNPSSPASS